MKERNTDLNGVLPDVPENINTENWWPKPQQFCTFRRAWTGRVYTITSRKDPWLSGDTRIIDCGRGDCVGSKNYLKFPQGSLRNIADSLIKRKR